VEIEKRETETSCTIRSLSALVSYERSYICTVDCNSDSKNDLTKLYALATNQTSRINCVGRAKVCLQSWTTDILRLLYTASEVARRRYLSCIDKLSGTQCSPETLPHKAVSGSE